MSIVFILPNIPDPRINKRINVAKQISDTSVICVRRKSQNIWEPYHKDVNHIIFDMDLPASSHIFKRFFMSHSFHNYKRYILKSYMQMGLMRCVLHFNIKENIRC